MENPQVGVVADDLTGALDTAGVLADSGLEALVALSPDAVAGGGGAGALCVNTQSRLMRESDAAQAVKRATRRLMGLGYRALYKKIDSTLRGHVGAEIIAMMEEARAGAALVCPAFPAMGRTVSDGTIYVHGQRAGRTPEGHREEASGPGPVSSLLERQTRRHVALISAGEVSQGADKVSRLVASLMGRGYRLLAFDAESNEHLGVVADVALRHPETIPVGSAGLALAIAGRLGESRPRTEGVTPMKVAPGPLLVVSGSLQRTTLRQLDVLRGVSRLRVVGVSSAALLGGSRGYAEEAKRSARRVAEALSDGYDAVITWTDPQAVEAAIGSARSPQEVVNRLGRAVGDLVASLFSSHQVSGLVLVGGETAYAVLSTLVAQGVRVAYQVLPGIPLGSIAGGLGEGRLVVTKAGGFGDEATLVVVMEHLRSLREARHS